jgi:hypothetical protein
MSKIKKEGPSVYVASVGIPVTGAIKLKKRFNETINILYVTNDKVSREEPLCRFYNLYSITIELELKHSESCL